MKGNTSHIQWGAPRGEGGVRQGQGHPSPAPVTGNTASASGNYCRPNQTARHKPKSYNSFSNPLPFSPLAFFSLSSRGAPTIAGGLALEVWGGFKPELPKPRWALPAGWAPISGQELIPLFLLSCPPCRLRWQPGPVLLGHQSQTSQGQTQPARPRSPGDPGSVFRGREVQLPDPSAEPSLALVVLAGPELLMAPPAAAVALQGWQEPGG